MDDVRSDLLFLRIQSVTSLQCSRESPLSYAARLCKIEHFIWNIFTRPRMAETIGPLLREEL